MAGSQYFAHAFKCASLFECIAAPVSPFDLAAGRMSERQLGDLARNRGFFAGPVAKTRSESVHRNAPPKKAGQEAAAARKTFGQCADELIKSKRREWRSEIHAAQWRRTIDDYCEPILDKPCDAIGTEAVLGVLQPVWGRIPETASRLRGRIEAVLDYAKANGLRSGENTAAWRGQLALILPKRQKLSRGHHQAMTYPDIPEFLGKLRESGSIQALALEFLILTAARSGEVLGARWAEFDLVPCSRSGKS